MRNTANVLVLLALFVILLSIPAIADAPPDPGGDPGGIGTPVGGGVPIDGGLLALLIAGVVYASRKTIMVFRSQN
jgi:hypothetical protein